MDEVQKLLSSWELSKLFDVLKEHEVCLLSLKYLTENDICELIPKIGLRSIFRARLQQWRQENCFEQFQFANTMIKDRKYYFEQSSHSSKRIRVEEPITVKQEIITSEVEGEEEFLENNTTTDCHLLEVLPNSPTSPLDEDYLNDTQICSNLKRKIMTASTDFSTDTVDTVDTVEELLRFEERAEFHKRGNNSFNGTEKKLNVSELLTGNFDGRKAISFYKIHNMLDINHRRKIVTVIICAAIEQKINMYTEMFDNIVKQILELFPNEPYDAYFTPRIGTSSPKGTLYNKFLNLSRQLRRDGLLGYRNKNRYLSRGPTSSTEIVRN